VPFDHRFNCHPGSPRRPGRARRRDAEATDAGTATAEATDAGTTTAETAVVLPVLVIVLLVCVWLLSAVGAQLRCVDAARVAARAAARGDAPGAVQAAGRAVAPTGAEVSVGRVGELVRVDVRAQVRPLPGVAALPGFGVSASAVARSEQMP